MIQAKLGSGAFLMGIDAENVRRLKAGQPLHIQLKMLGGTDSVIVMYGDTQEDILDELRKLGPLPPAQPWPEGDHSA